MSRLRTSRTTLERRGRLIFALFILLTVVACLAWPWLQMGALARSSDPERARERAYAYLEHLHGISLAPNKTTADHPRLVTMKGDEKVRVIRLEPSPAGPQTVPPGLSASDFETEAIRTFLKEPTESQFYRDTGDRFQQVQALRAESKCLDCHGTKYKQGELIGVASLELDVSQRNSLLLVSRLVLATAALVVVAVSVATFYALFRTMVVRPIRHLKDVADRVSEGDLQVRSAIDTGNELEALSDALNRMLDQMLKTQADLRRATEVRDAKLDELAKANVALFEMNQVKNKFFTTMSHELRTPLNSILGFAQILRESEPVAADAKLRRYVDNIQSSGRMLLEMINDLLDLAKIEAGRVQVRCEKVSPQDIVEAAMNLVRPTLAGKDLKLGFEVAPATPVMITDATKVQQILYNLLSNAVKFTDEGEVRLTVHPAGSARVAFDVSDTGPGIAREQQLRIFERFTQLDSSYTRRYRGTGLGLSIVKELTGLLGGEVAVESEVGRGSTFTVVLPVDSRDAVGRTTEEAPGTGRPSEVGAGPTPATGGSGPQA